MYTSTSSTQFLDLFTQELDLHITQRDGIRFLQLHAGGAVLDKTEAQQTFLVIKAYGKVMGNGVVCYREYI